MMSEDQQSQALLLSLKKKAIGLLAFKERSRKDLAAKLADAFPEAPEEMISEVLEFLEEHKYLSNERYARSRLITRSSRYGNVRLRQELRREGISEEEIEEAFEELEIPEEPRAYALWERKFGEVAEDPKEKARQFRFLASRGFSFKTVNLIINGEYDPEEY